MEKYSLKIKKSVAKDLRGIPAQNIARILKAIEGLRDNPRPAGAVKLTGLDLYRIRVGVYRVVYEIQDVRLIVVIVKAAHRGNIYANY
ncbi:MAG: addiction module antitoxin [Spirochaeta sp. LUC14_002_19_P3]|nr:MAG: addiction module antitoxin [Spirochaeta sp. LUC14_002_19_P3]